MTPFVFIVLAAAVAITIAYVQWRIEKARTEKIAAYARERGFRFAPEKTSSAPNFAIFERGHSRAAFNTMRFTLELRGRSCDAQAGDFRYKVTSGSGKNRRTTTYHFSYLCLAQPFAGAPELSIRREGFLDKIADALGFDDIDFESEEFSRKFRVKSADKKFAFDVIHPRMIEFLMRAPSEALALAHGECAYSDGAGSRWEPREFDAAVAFVREFFELWPEHLTARLDARLES